MDTLFVLCPGNPEIKDDQVILENNDGNGYLGSQVRLDAAVKVSENVKHVVLVGGTKGRVLAMEKYLIDKGCEAEKLTKLVSEPNTLGNIWAVRLFLELFPNCRKEIGILTNSYHRERVMLFAEEIFKPTGLTALVFGAEDFVKPEINDHFEKEMEKRLANEKRGSKEWKSGNYQNQHSKNFSFQVI